MSTDNNQEELLQEERQFSNPDAFLTLNDGDQSEEKKKKKNQQLLQLSIYGRVGGGKGKDGDGVKRGRKKIRRPADSQSDYSESFQETRRRRQGGGRKPGQSTRGRGKPRKRGRGTDIEEMKRELTDLQKDFFPQNRISQGHYHHSSKRGMMCDLSRIEYIPATTVWKSKQTNEEDWNSMEASMGEDSCQRDQGNTLKKMMELVNSSSDNIVQKMGQLPQFIRKVDLRTA